MQEDKDMKILALLLEDGRRSVVEISDQLRIPRATVQERMKKLVKSGVIRKFAALPDYSKIGQPVTAYIFISFRNEKDVSHVLVAKKPSRFRILRMH